MRQNHGEQLVEMTHAYGTLALASRNPRTIHSQTEEEIEREMFLHLFHPNLTNHPELWTNDEKGVR